MDKIFDTNDYNSGEGMLTAIWGPSLILTWTTPETNSTSCNSNNSILCYVSFSTQQTKHTHDTITSNTARQTQLNNNSTI